MKRAIREIWHRNDSPSLDTEIHVPDEFSKGLVRCKIIYGPDIRNITFEKCEKRIIRSLKLVTCDSIDYHVKYDDRRLLESLFEQRGTCDEILIVKNGFISDTSISNIVFKDGKYWVTPTTPLLSGTCRERLINENRLVIRDIRPEDITLYEGCKPINAMRDPDEVAMIPVSQIYQ
jgi:4-amino-4-deoxychorismate lyase